MGLPLTLDQRALDSRHRIGKFELIEFRAFDNSDVPRVAALWSNAPATPGLMRSMSVSILERHVFSKPYFDRQGFILARDGENVVGFVHAGFGPNDQLSDISMDSGVICLVVVLDMENQVDVRKQLIQQAEQYLMQRDAREIHAGCINTRSPFYLGLYGGSDMAGILESDTRNLEAFRQLGYAPDQRIQRYALSITNYRPPTDRRLVQNRRKFSVEADFNVKSSSWWEACQFGHIDRLRFRVRPRSGGPPAGELTLWEMGSLNPESGRAAMGLVDLVIDERQQNQGLASQLVIESIRQIQGTGVGSIQAQVFEQNEAARRLFENLGFEKTGIGVFLQKSTT